MPTTGFDIDKILDFVDSRKAKEFVKNMDFGGIPESLRGTFCPICGNVLRTSTELQLGFHFESNKMKCFKKISKGIKYDTKEGD